jgi:hypothetical protein
MKIKHLTELDIFLKIKFHKKMFPNKEKFLCLETKKYIIDISSSLFSSLTMQIKNDKLEPDIKNNLRRGILWMK